MRTPEEPEIRELIHKCWMTHDGMWFAHAAKELGMDVANRLNKAANGDLAKIEIKRAQKLFGIEKVSNFEEFKTFFDASMGVLKAGFMEFSAEFIEPDRMRMRMGRCFALEGMKRLGVEKQYECGIYNRLENWLNGLGITWTATPNLLHCLQLETGKCEREYTLSFQTA